MQTVSESEFQSKCLELIEEGQRKRRGIDYHQRRQTGFNTGAVQGKTENAVRPGTLEGFHGDPADRIIAATALIHDATLLTADKKILAWPSV